MNESIERWLQRRPRLLALVAVRREGQGQWRWRGAFLWGTVTALGTIASCSQVLSSPKAFHDGWEQAKDHFVPGDRCDALASDPELPDHRDQATESIAKIDEAINTCKAAAEGGGADVARYRLQLGRAYQVAGNLPLAMRQYDIASTLYEPTDAGHFTAMARLGASRIRMHDDPGARAVLEPAQAAGSRLAMFELSKLVTITPAKEDGDAVKRAASLLQRSALAGYSPARDAIAHRTTD